MSVENNKGSFVIDCNVAIKWFLVHEKDSNEALDLLYKAINREISLFAPETLLLEFANVLTKHIKINPSFKETYLKHFEKILDVSLRKKILTLILLTDYKPEILELAFDKKIFYFDAEYLYLSRKLKADLITYDKALKKIANR